MERYELNEKQLGTLIDILALHFPKADALNAALQRNPPGKPLNHYTAAAVRDHAYLELINIMAARGQLGNLYDIVAANAGNNKPSITSFQRVLKDLGHAPSGSGGRVPTPKPRGARQQVRRITYTLLYCRVRSPQGNKGAISISDVADQLKARIDLRLKLGRKAYVDYDNGFLVLIASPARAIGSALDIQSIASAAVAGVPEAAISVGLAQAELGENESLPEPDPRLRFVRAVADMGEHQQILVTRNVHESLRGISVVAPSGAEAQTEHFDDYALPQGDVADLYEYTDATIRQPQAPPAGKSAMPAQRQLEAAGFTILERLTKTGSTVVYKAKDRNDELVAIKVLTEDLGTNDALNSAFLKPAKALMKAPHEGIVHIRETHEAGLPYFVMDWIEGEELDYAIADDPAFDRALDIAIRICDAVSHAHEHEVGHGDLKPSNIIVRTADSHPVLLDFGQLDWAPTGASETNRGALGTPLYVAPELIDDAGVHTSKANGARLAPKVTEVADIYSLGVLLYEMFVGEAPFAMPPSPRPRPEEEPLWRKLKPYLLSRQAVLEAHVSADPMLPRIINPDFDPDLEAVILKAIEKDPHTRYATAAELAQDLRRVRDEEAVSARPRIYDNMTETRARSAMREVQLWKDQQQITPQEFGRLRRAYDPLLRSGRSAVGEARLTHLSITLLYFFAALLVSGAALFLINHGFNAVSQAPARTGIGLAIPALAGLAWLAMRRAGRYRVAFALGIMTVTSLPLAVTNTLYELQPDALSWSYYSGKALLGVTPPREEPLEAEESSEGLLAEEAGENPLQRFADYANWQIWLGLAAALAGAFFIAQKSRTITIAVVGAALLSALYIVSMDFVGLMYFLEADHLYTGGLLLLLFIPIALALTLVSRVGSFRMEVAAGGVLDIARIADEMERRRLSLPFVYAAILFLIVGTTLVAFDAPKSLLGAGWTTGGEVIARCLLFALAGVLFYGIADGVVRHWFSDANFGYWLLYYLGSTYTVVGLLLGDRFAVDSVDWWPRFPIGGANQDMSLGIPLVIVVCVVLLAESTRLNSKGLLAYGLAALTAVLWYVEFVYFRGGSAVWAYSLVTMGTVALVVTCAVQLFPIRKPDIDDVAERLIRWVASLAQKGGNLP